MDQRLMQDEHISRIDRLNRRQRDTLYLVAKGLRNNEMAKILHISERTVKGYLSQLFLIFDVSNRTELVGATSSCLTGGPSDRTGSLDIYKPLTNRISSRSD